MLIATPPIKSGLTKRLRELDGLRERLGHEVGRSTPWMGALRRLARATSVESSTSIEGFHVSQAEAVALVSGAERPDPEDLDRTAVSCYGLAMDHVGVMAGDPAFRWLDRVLLDLHFDACHFQRQANPGLWRTGPIGITGDDGRLVYQGPPAADTPTLMGEVIDWLQNGDLNAHVVVRAAMAHLHVVSIHPFRDGNGRVSRIVQSLVLAREGLVSAEFGSIEEYLSDHTRAYYAALQAAHGKAYEPLDSDAAGWVRALRRGPSRAGAPADRTDRAGQHQMVAAQASHRAAGLAGSAGHRARTESDRRLRPSAVRERGGGLAGDRERGLPASGGRGADRAQRPYSQGSLRGERRTSR